MICNAFDVVVVPFPFTDSTQSKKRPAVVLSSNANFNGQIGHSVLAMITSAKNTRWPLDVTISDLKGAGLPAPSVIRMKLFTLDHRFIADKIGRIAKKDQKKLQAAVSALLKEQFE